MTRRGLLLAAMLATLIACGPSTTRVRGANTPTHGTSAAHVDWPSLDQWTRTAEAPDDVAVIVAIEDYAFLPDVPGATTNASEWEAYFLSRGMKDIFVVTNGDAASEEMLRYADVAAKTAKPSSRVWYVFVGHGAPATDGSDGVLIGMDARQTPDSITARGVRQKDLLQRLEAGQQAQTIVVVDACFSGRSADGQALARGTQPVLPVKPTMNLNPKTVVLSAAKADQFAGALPGADRPAFSYLLLGALRGWADDGDGKLTAGAAMEYVERQMRHVTGRTQTPELSGASGAVLTANAREGDPGVAERMRLASSGAPVLGDDNAVRVDTGAGVVVTQLDGWTPISPNGALVAFENPRANEGYFYLFGWKDPEGRGHDWVNELHNEYQKLEEQIRPTQVVTLGPNKVFETAYLAKVEGGPITIYVWDIVKPGAFYRALGMSFNSDKYGSADYKDFHAFVQKLKFSSASSATRLSDGTPGVLGRVSTTPLPYVAEYAKIPPLAPGFEQYETDKEGTLLFRHPDGTAYVIVKTVFDTAKEAEAEVRWNESNDWVTAPTKVKRGGQDWTFAEERENEDGKKTRTLGFFRVSNHTLWYFSLYVADSLRDKYAAAFVDLISNTKFHQ